MVALESEGRQWAEHVVCSDRKGAVPQHLEAPDESEPGEPQ